MSDSEKPVYETPQIVQSFAESDLFEEDAANQLLANAWGHVVSWKNCKAQ